MFYVGQYINDFGKVLTARLDVYFVSKIQGRVETTQEIDNTYLPSVFKINTSLYDDVFNACPLSKGQREARFWINEDAYLRVPVPFRPGGTSFNQFFIEAKFNQNIFTIGTKGEVISDDFVSLYARRNS